jgi:Fe-S-cluster containining protein
VSDDDATLLERQLERGSLFVHTSLGEAFLRIGDTRAFLFALIDLLLQKGLLTEAEVEATVGRIRLALAERGELDGPGTAVRVDPETVPTDPVPVDCQARMAVCHAVCCKLHFALSVAEVETGHVKWDLGRPYFIRHDPDGRCTHGDGQTGACRVYEQRPLVCRRYSCAGDSRIWADFDAMALNQPWIDEHLMAQERVTGTLMHADELLQIRRPGK